MKTIESVVRGYIAKFVADKERKSFEWKDLVKFVKERNVKVEDWRDVRSAMYESLDDETITRTADIHEERYIRCQASKMRVYLVNVTRSESVTKQFSVMAEHPILAKIKAVEDACGTVFERSSDAEYEADIV